MGESQGCKVCRVLADYDVEHYDDRLLEMWRDDPARRKGYRELARWLNTTLLRREMDDAGLSTVGGEAESKYERLTSDAAYAEEVATLLEREGIDVDDLRADFVSYGVVRRHLTECLGAEYERDGDGDDGWERDALETTRDHAAEKLRQTATALANKGELACGGDLSVHVSFEVECEACHARVPIDRAMRRGAVCRCGERTEAES